MRERLLTNWLVMIGVVALVAAPALAQWTSPDDRAAELLAARGEGETPSPRNPYTPPPCVAGVPFADVTCSTFYDAWIEQFAADGITAGCGGGNYCPNENVTRAQMAVFIEAAMHGTANWSPGDLGNYNTGIGGGSLPFTATGMGNTAVGGASLASNTAGEFNTAVGESSLVSNTTASDNTAVGYSALWLQSYDPGGPWVAENTAVGAYALTSNQPDGGHGGLNGTQNAAVGAEALSANTTGYRDTAVGYQAGARSDQVPTWTGGSVTLVPNQTGSYNTFIGMAGATTQVSNCTAIGQDAYCDASNQVRLGNYYVTSIGGKVAWSALSDARAKADITDLDLGLDLVMALRPVSYRLKGGNGRIDLGFVAQDVEAVLGDAYNVVDVGRDPDRTLSLRYTDLIAPLVKAVQEQQAEIAERDARVAALEASVTAQQAQIDELKAEMGARLKAQPPSRASGPK